jgi:hypothetical protein
MGCCLVADIHTSLRMELVGMAARGEDKLKPVHNKLL